MSAVFITCKSEHLEAVRQACEGCGAKHLSDPSLDPRGCWFSCQIDDEGVKTLADRTCGMGATSFTAW